MHNDQYQRTKNNYKHALERRAKQLGFDSLEELREAEKENKKLRRDYKKLQGFKSNR